MVRALVLSIVLPSSLVALPDGGGVPRTEPVVFGDYLEARNAAVPAGLVIDRGARQGAAPLHRAVLAWRVERGHWNGEDLAGLGMVLVIESEGMRETPLEGARVSALFIDREASEPQASALVALARELAPRSFEKLAKLSRARLRFERQDHGMLLEIPEIVQVRAESHADGDGAEHCEAVCARDPRPARPLSRYVRAEGAHALAEVSTPPARGALASDAAVLGRFGI